MNNSFLLGKIINNKKIDNNINQVILVNKDKLFFYNKENREWKKVLETDCEYGKNGYAVERKEGDCTTPIGTFKLLYAFGTEDNPGTQMEYKKILETSYYSDDIDKPSEYNTWIESNKEIRGEHLIEYPLEYHYGIVIGFNVEPVIVGKGSSIFLHCKGKKGYTAGCIAVDENKMLIILKQLKPGAYIVIIP